MKLLVAGRLLLLALLAGCGTHGFHSNSPLVTPHHVGSFPASALFASLKEKRWSPQGGTGADGELSWSQLAQRGATGNVDWYEKTRNAQVQQQQREIESSFGTTNKVKKNQQWSPRGRVLWFPPTPKRLAFDRSSTRAQGAQAIAPSTVQRRPSTPTASAAKQATSQWSPRGETGATATLTPNWFAPAPTRKLAFERTRNGATPTKKWTPQGATKGLSWLELQERGATGHPSWFEVMERQAKRSPRAGLNGQQVQPQQRLIESSFATRGAAASAPVGTAAAAAPVRVPSQPKQNFQPHPPSVPPPVRQDRSSSAASVGSKSFNAPIVSDNDAPRTDKDKIGTKKDVGVVAQAPAAPTRDPYFASVVGEAPEKAAVTRKQEDKQPVSSKASLQSDSAVQAKKDISNDVVKPQPVANKTPRKAPLHSTSASKVKEDLPDDAVKDRLTKKEDKSVASKAPWQSSSSSKAKEDLLDDAVKGRSTKKEDKPVANETPRKAAWSPTGAGADAKPAASKVSWKAPWDKAKEEAAGGSKLSLWEKLFHFGSASKAKKDATDGGKWNPVANKAPWKAPWQSDSASKAKKDVADGAKDQPRKKKDKPVAKAPWQTASASKAKKDVAPRKEKAKPVAKAPWQSASASTAKKDVADDAPVAKAAPVKAAWSPSSANKAKEDAVTDTETPVASTVPWQSSWQSGGAASSDAPVAKAAPVKAAWSPGGANKAKEDSDAPATTNFQTGWQPGQK